MSKFGGVLKTHTIHNNSHNKAGRQLQFTSEVTLIGTHIVSKFQPNPTIIAKVIEHFVHSSFFQDHFHSRPLYFSLFPAQWQDSSYSNHPHSTGPLRTSRQHSRSGRVTSPLHWKRPIFPKTDGMPASLVSWAPKASSDGSILKFPKMMTSRKSRRTYSKPSQTR